jgi:hypothetical protein
VPTARPARPPTDHAQPPQPTPSTAAQPPGNHVDLLSVVLIVLIFLCFEVGLPFEVVLALGAVETLVLFIRCGRAGHRLPCTFMPQP